MIAGRDPHLAIVGGSIAGCAAAIAFRQTGARTTVFERSAAHLQERGFGIGLPAPTLRELTRADFVDASMPTHSVDQRLWITRGAHGAGEEHLLWRQSSEVCLCNWGMLWQSLRRRVPDSDYRTGATVAAIAPGTAGCGVLVGGDPENFDAVVGADGIHSLVRRSLTPESSPRDSGYALWRSCYPEEMMPRPAPELESGFATLVFPHGQAVVYLIPDRRGRTHRLLNWAVYAYPPQAMRIGSRPPGADAPVGDYIKEIVQKHLPTRWAELISATPGSEIAFYPVMDLTLPDYGRDRVALIGDAGTITRPHTASGAVKALDDALYLRKALRNSGHLPEAFDGYRNNRCQAGNELTALGRRMGRDQIEYPPDWLSMSADAMDDWARGTLSGSTHYLYGNIHD